MRPDAFGVLKREGKAAALLPGMGAAGGAAGYDGGPHRALPALLRRQQASGRPRRSAPAVLVVFDDDIAAGHFLRLAGDEMRRTGVKVPLRVSHKAVLERLGPLGTTWQVPGSWEPARAL